MTGKRYDVVIVGGGCIGSATAYFLKSENDFKGTVLVIERDPTYEFCSTSRATGGVRQQFSTPENIEIGLFGAKFLKNVGEHLEVNGEKPSISFREDGYLLLGTDEAMPVLRENHALQIKHGAEIAWLERDELKARYPWMHVDDVPGGFLGVKNEGWYDPFGLLTAYKRKARSIGTEYLNDEAVGLERKGDRVVAVNTKANGRIEAGIVLNAAGARDAAKVAQWAGVSLPVEPRKRSAFVVSCPQTMPGGPLRFEPNGVWSRPEGKFLLCGVSPAEDADPATTEFEPDHYLFEDVVWPTLAERVPIFEALRVERAYAGHYDHNTLDQNAIIGLYPGLENFYVATGFSGHGVMQSPATGRAVTELIVHGGYRTLDLKRFGVERVLTGEPIRETGIY
ncbi:MAG: NAD(P)/FAD-dependent oxidoreductase [Alphaproteobacteria bacterium]